MSDYDLLLMPRANATQRAATLRRNLRLLTADGALWAVMTGTGEWQFVLFALAIGLSEVRAGLVSTIPLFIGSILQLITPWGVRRTGSLRRWVWICVGWPPCCRWRWCGVRLDARLLGRQVHENLATLLLGCIIAYWGVTTAPPWQAWFTRWCRPMDRPSWVFAGSSRSDGLRHLPASSGAR